MRRENTFIKQGVYLVMPAFTEALFLAWVRALLTKVGAIGGTFTFASLPKRGGAASIKAACTDVQVAEAVDEALA